MYPCRAAPGQAICRCVVVGSRVASGASTRTCDVGGLVAWLWRRLRRRIRSTRRLRFCLALLQQRDQFFLTTPVADLELLPAPARAGFVATGETHTVANRPRSLCIAIGSARLLRSKQTSLLLGFHLAQMLLVLEGNRNNLVDDVALDIGFQFFEHRVGIPLILDKRIALRDSLQPDLLTQILHAGQGNRSIDGR
jgi:hypothetical protein